MYRQVEVTMREVLASIVIVLIMVGAGFFIADTIHDNLTSDNEKYFKALKIDNNPNLFDYSIRTEVGDMLSYGTFKAKQPVSDALVKGKYFAMEKTEEHYTMHTRTVSYKCGKSTCFRTEVYWTWDEVGSEIFTTKTFTFLGRTFDYNKVNFHHYQYLDTIHTDYHVRFQFYVIPTEFKGTLYSIAKDKTIKDNTLYANQKIKEVMNDIEHDADKWVLFFWIGWIVLILIIVVVFWVLENKYLNNHKGYYKM